jgi:hypothetical protein
MWLSEQTTPQPPQSFGLVCGFTSQPLVCRLLSQSRNGATQLPVQAPLVHATEETLFDEHDAPHAPQLAVLEAMFVSQPFVCLLPSQSANPAAHVPLHVPLVQARVAMLLGEQVLPQTPQLLTSVPVAVSQPFVCLLPSQSA